MAKVETLSAPHAATSPVQPATAPLNWREELPTLTRPAVTLREPSLADAVALLTALPEHALREIVAAPPPATVAGFETFVARLQADRRAGLLAAWAIVPDEPRVPVGLIGVRAMDAQASMVEGFAVIAEEFRGTPLFQTAGRMMLSCLFGPMRAHRAEFRVDVRNGRANGALRKLGATQEGLLRRARRQDGEFHDQVLWAIVATDWSDQRVIRSLSVH